MAKQKEHRGRKRTRVYAKKQPKTHQKTEPETNRTCPFPFAVCPLSVAGGLILEKTPVAIPTRFVRRLAATRRRAAATTGITIGAIPFPPECD